MTHLEGDNDTRPESVVKNTQLESEDSGQETVRATKQRIVAWMVCLTVILLGHL